MGFSRLRLDRLHRVLSGCVERHELSGLVALISHRDDVHVETLGTLAFDRSAPMRRDTIFRIASITKPVTAVAAMLLVEDCRIRLDDPIDPWLPELAHRRVLKMLSSPIDDTVPARRSITVRDLLTSRMGFGSVMARPDTYPIQRQVREYRLGGDGPHLPNRFPPFDEWLARLGSLPLMEHPGEQWRYHTSLDALGALVARVSGQSLGEFMRERIFEPLGMKDTAFHLPADKIDRFPACYRLDPQTRTLELYDGIEDSAWRGPIPFETGGGGLLSTLDDYFAFSRMLLNKGRYDGGQLLSRASVELMTMDHVSAGQRHGQEPFFGGHSSWGFGMGIAIQRQEIYQTPGRFGWDGGYGTSAYTDPAEGVIGILFTQRLVESPEPPHVYTNFWTTAYAAVD